MVNIAQFGSNLSENFGEYLHLKILGIHVNCNKCEVQIIFRAQQCCAPTYAADSSEKRGKFSDGSADSLKSRFFKIY